MPGCGGGSPSKMSTFTLVVTITHPSGAKMTVPAKIMHFTEQEAHKVAKEPYGYAITQGYAVEVTTKETVPPKPAEPYHRV